MSAMRIDGEVGQIGMMWPWLLGIRILELMRVVFGSIGLLGSGWC